ncbi:HD domain-containing phosphohydrolase [Aeromicrobium sp.]|uniref:HD domain-containing phosphohydrolase n=1 Tax=Aeromicrobium sp. TaxID=1871063 RepID=UPI003C57ACF1
MHADTDRGGVRLAELVAALSLGIDLGFDQPMEHVLRQCLIALRLAEQIGVDETTRSAVYYTALLTNVGCHSDAHEQAKWFGDDIGLKADKYAYGLHGLGSAVAGVRRLGSGAESVARRFRVGLEFAVSGHRNLNEMVNHHSEMARTLGEQLGLPETVLEALGASYEQWDGKGWPGNLKGDAVPIATRLAAIGEFTEVALRVGGVDAAVNLVRGQRGKQFDPRLSDVFESHATILLTELDTTDTWDAVIGAEPALGVLLTDEQFDVALLAVADFIDLKSPYTLGHARAVADLAEDAAKTLGMSEDEVRTVRRAGLVHSFGKLGVSNAILDKPTPLGAGERERLRMVPYLTGRMLRQSPALAPLGVIAVQHAERLDGSGYPHGLAGAAISRPARVLGAADAYQSMREPRAHREPMSPEQAAVRLRELVTKGQLEPDSVDAVLEAAGHRVPRRRAGPAGLTAREIDVLRLLARGLTNKEIAERLVISRKTVANHVEHIFAKIKVSTRTAAGLFATQHGLLGDEEPVTV